MLYINSKFTLLVISESHLNKIYRRGFMKLVPEMYCRDINVTKKFYTQVLHFKIKYERKEEAFVYFIKDGVELMFEQLKVENLDSAVSRRWLATDQQVPFGVGVNLQIGVVDVEGLFDHVKKVDPESVFMDIETKNYQCGDKMYTQKQFIVKDPDGFLLRFCDDNE